jgi:hypothetical protein
MHRATCILQYSMPTLQRLYSTNGSRVKNIDKFKSVGTGTIQGQTDALRNGPGTVENWSHMNQIQAYLVLDRREEVRQAP